MSTELCICIAVRKATAEELARYKPQAKRELKEPVFAVRAGEITLLVEYDMQANAIPSVGQLGAAYQPPRCTISSSRNGSSS